MRNRKQEVKLTLKRYKKLIQKNINSRKNVRRNTKPNCICKLCHFKFHIKYGKYWNTTEQFVEFIHAT